jgi:Arc/MetJ family transcription regulator
LTFACAHCDYLQALFYGGVYVSYMGRTNIVIDDNLIRQARKLTGLRTKQQIVDKALDLLLRTESRSGILRYYGTGVWHGDLKQSRRSRRPVNYAR